MAYYSYPGEFFHGTNIIIDNIIVFLDFMKSSYPVFPTIPPPPKYSAHNDTTYPICNLRK